MFNTVYMSTVSIQDIRILMDSVLSMSTLLIQDIRISNAFSAIYVNTVNTKALNSVMCSILYIYVDMSIQDIRISNAFSAIYVSMSTLLMQIK